MPTSVREAIMDQLVTDLAKIGTTVSYSATKTPTVVRARRAAPEQLPWIMVGTTAINYEPVGQTGAVGTYARTMDVQIEYAFAAGEIDADASAALHDLELCLADWTVEGTATMLTFISASIALDEPTDPYVVVTMQVQILYRTDTSLPSTRV